jgi:TP901 family phage tail tape measure protein
MLDIMQILVDGVSSLETDPEMRGKLLPSGDNLRARVTPSNMPKSLSRVVDQAVSAMQISKAEETANELIRLNIQSGGAGPNVIGATYDGRKSVGARKGMPIYGSAFGGTRDDMALNAYRVAREEQAARGVRFRDTTFGLLMNPGVDFHDPDMQAFRKLGPVTGTDKTAKDRARAIGIGSRLQAEFDDLVTTIANFEKNVAEKSTELKQARKTGSKDDIREAERAYTRALEEQAAFLGKIDQASGLPELFERRRDVGQRLKAERRGAADPGRIGILSKELSEIGEQIRNTPDILRELSSPQARRATEARRAAGNRASYEASKLTPAEIRESRQDNGAYIRDAVLESFVGPYQVTGSRSKAVTAKLFPNVRVENGRIVPTDMGGVGKGKLAAEQYLIEEAIKSGALQDVTDAKGNVISARQRVNAAKIARETATPAQIKQSQRIFEEAKASVPQVTDDDLKPFNKTLRAIASLEHERRRVMAQIRESNAPGAPLTEGQTGVISRIDERSKVLRTRLVNQYENATMRVEVGDEKEMLSAVQALLARRRDLRKLKKDASSVEKQQINDELADIQDTLTKLPRASELRKKIARGGIDRLPTSDQWRTDPTTGEQYLYREWTPAIQQKAVSTESAAARKKKSQFNKTLQNFEDVGFNLEAIPQNINKEAVNKQILKSLNRLYGTTAKGIDELVESLRSTFAEAAKAIEANKQRVASVTRENGRIVARNGAGDVVGSLSFQRKGNALVADEMQFAKGYATSGLKKDLLTRLREAGFKDAPLSMREIGRSLDIDTSRLVGRTASGGITDLSIPVGGRREQEAHEDYAARVASDSKQLRQRLQKIDPAIVGAAHRLGIAPENLKTSDLKDPAALVNKAQIDALREPLARMGIRWSATFNEAIHAAKTVDEVFAAIEKMGDSIKITAYTGPQESYVAGVKPGTKDARTAKVIGTAAEAEAKRDRALKTLDRENAKLQQFMAAAGQQGATPLDNSSDADEHLLKMRQRLRRLEESGRSGLTQEAEAEITAIQAALGQWEIVSRKAQALSQMAKRGSGIAGKPATVGQLADIGKAQAETTAPAVPGEVTAQRHVVNSLEAAQRAHARAAALDQYANMMEENQKQIRAGGATTSIPAALYAQAAGRYRQEDGTLSNPSRAFTRMASSGDVTGIRNVAANTRAQLAGSGRGDLAAIDKALAEERAKLAAMEKEFAASGGGRGGKGKGTGGSFDDCCNRIVEAINKVVTILEKGVKFVHTRGDKAEPTVDSAIAAGNTRGGFSSTPAGRASAIAAIRSDDLRNQVLSVKDEASALEAATRLAVEQGIARKKALQLVADQAGITGKAVKDLDDKLKASIADAELKKGVTTGGDAAARRAAAEDLTRLRKEQKQYVLDDRSNAVMGRSGITQQARDEVAALKALDFAKADVAKRNEHLVATYKALMTALTDMTAAERRNAIKNVFNAAGAPVRGSEMADIAKMAGDVPAPSARAAASRAGADIGTGMGEGAMSAFERTFFGNNGFWSRVLHSTGTFLVRNFTAGFVFGLTNALQDMLRQGIETEAVFVRVSNALEATGRESGNLRTDLLSISTDYGVSLENVYKTAAGLTGMFEDVQDISGATRVISELDMISGGALSAGEGIGALSSITSAYGVTGAEDLAHVADVLTVIQNRLGTNIEVTAEGLGRISGLAKQLGLPLEDAATYIGAIAKLTNQTGSAAGEQFQRIIAVMQSGRGQAVLRKELAGTGIEKALNIDPTTGKRDYDQALKILLANYQSLTTAQRENITVTLGGQRQAAALNALLEQGNKVLDTAAAAHMANGEAQERAQKIAEQLNTQIKIMQTNFTAFAAELVRSGLFNVFAAALNILNRTLSFFSHTLSSINTAIDQNELLSFMRGLGGLAIGAAGAIWVLARAFHGAAAAMGRASTAALGMMGSQSAQTTATRIQTTAMEEQAIASLAAQRAAATGTGVTGGVTAAQAALGIRGFAQPFAMTAQQRRLAQAAAAQGLASGVATRNQAAAMAALQLAGVAPTGTGRLTRWSEGLSARAESLRATEVAKRAAFYTPGAAGFVPAEQAGRVSTAAARTSMAASAGAAKALDGVSSAMAGLAAASMATKIGLLGVVALIASVAYYEMDKAKREEDFQKNIKIKFTQEGRDSKGETTIGRRYVGPNTDQWIEDQKGN